MSTSVIEDVAAEMSRQDDIHPDGFPSTRDGIRLAIAAAEDELMREVWPAWHAARCKCPEPRCGHADWSEVREEAIQCAAVLLRMASNIAEAPDA
jgi:hypothetical protein